MKAITSVISLVLLVSVPGLAQIKQINRLDWKLNLKEEVCLDGETRFEVIMANTAITTSSSYSYTVQGGSVVSQDVNTVVLRWDTTGTQGFGVEVMTPDSVAYSASRTLTIREGLPTAAIDIQGPESICSGNAVKFNVDYPGEGVFFWWSVDTIAGGGTEGMGQNGTARWKIPGLYEVQARAYNACGNGSMGLDTIRVTRTPSGIGKLLGLDVPHCLGDTLLYTLPDHEDGDTYDFRIYFYNGNYEQVNDSSWQVVYTGAQSTMLYIWPKSKEGCIPPRPSWFFTDVDATTELDEVHLYNYVSREWNPVCPGENEEFLVNEDYRVMDWQVPEGGTVLTDSSRRLVVHWETAGEYTIKAVPYNNCGVGDTVRYTTRVGMGGAEPTRPLKSIWLRQGQAEATRARVNFGRGKMDGYKVLAVMRVLSDTSADAVPVDGSAYTESREFGAGSDLGGGNYAVYSRWPGLFQWVDVYNLSPCTPYRVSTYPFTYNVKCPIIGPAYNYFLDSLRYIDFYTAPLEWQAARPEVGTRSMRFTRTGDSTLQVSMSTGEGTHRLVIAREGEAVDAVARDRQHYPASAVYGEGYGFDDGSFAVYNGTGSSVEVSGLKPNLSYHFKVVEYNEGGGCTVDVAYAGDVLSGPAPTLLVLGLDPAVRNESRVYQPAGADWLEVQLPAPASAQSVAELYDVQGRVLQSAQFLPGAERMQLALPPELKSQVCMVHVITETGREVHRLVIR